MQALAVKRANSCCSAAARRCGLGSARALRGTVVVRPPKQDCAMGLLLPSHNGGVIRVTPAGARCLPRRPPHPRPASLDRVESRERPLSTYRIARWALSKCRGDADAPHDVRWTYVVRLVVAAVQQQTGRRGAAAPGVACVAVAVDGVLWALGHLRLLWGAYCNPLRRPTHRLRGCDRLPIIVTICLA